MDELKGGNLLNKFKNLILIGIIFILSILSPIETVFANDVTYEKIWNMDLTAKPSKPLTEEIMIEAAKKSGNPNATLIKNNKPEYLIKASERYGVNPYIIMWMAIVESGWNGSEVSEKLNNFGGMMCSTRADKCSRTDGSSCVSYDDVKGGLRCFTHYAKEEDYFFDKAYTVRHEYYERGAKTFGELIVIYAPSKENNLNQYTQSLVNSSGHFSVSYKDIDSGDRMNEDGSVTVGDGKRDESENKPYSKEDMEIFKESIQEQMKLGLSNTGNTLEEAPYIQYAIQHYSQKTYYFLLTLGYMIVALTIMYMAFMGIGYALYVRGTFAHNVAEKMFGSEIANSYGDRRGILLVGKRILFGIFLIAFLVSGFHIHLFGAFYELVGQFISSI